METTAAKVERLEKELEEARTQLRKEIEEKNAQGETCGRRMSEPGPWKHEEGLDGYDVLPNGDRVCTFCGSLHHEDVRRLVDEAIAGDPADRANSVTIEVATGKNYKVYINQPGIRNALEGGIKFYTHHLRSMEEEDRKKLVDDLNTASKRFVESLYKDS